MFVTTKITWSIATGEILEHQGYHYFGFVELACDASSKEKKIAGKINDFSDFMVSQAKDVFGKDSIVFNNMLKAWDSIVSQGPNQHGFNAATKSDLTSSAITNNANQYRNISGAVKAGQAGYGGGDNVTESGTTVGQNLSVAQAAAAHTAGELNQIDQADYEVGRENFFKAGEMEQRLPSTFDNLAPLDHNARGGLNDSLQEQKSLDAAGGWWKKPVMGLVSAGLNVATGGLEGMASGVGFKAGAANATGNNAEG